MFKSQWLENVKKYLCNLGFSGIWYNQCVINSKWLIMSSRQKLKDLFIQNWMSEINNTSATNVYTFLKTEFEQSTYIKSLPLYLCQQLMAFVTRNHNLPVETGRWGNIPSTERKCTICNDLGDEYHYFMVCPLFNDDRKRYIERNVYRRPNMIKFINLLTSKNCKKLRTVALFCNTIIKYFRNKVV